MHSIWLKGSHNQVFSTLNFSPKNKKPINIDKADTPQNRPQAPQPQPQPQAPLQMPMPPMMGGGNKKKKQQQICLINAK